MSTNCENCMMCARAEQKPHSFFAILWRWHKRWCPGWSESIPVDMDQR